ncbi:MAG: TonB-dependent receptor [Candidatus Neomarinimicrobiota bacterium]
MKKWFCLMLILVARLQAANISGYIVDDKTGEAIIGVNVLVDNTGLGAATDLRGFFVVRQVPAGSRILRLSHISYAESEIPIGVQDKAVFLGTLKMTARALPTSAVEIIGQRRTLIEKDLDIASFQVDPIVLLEAPQLHDDVFQLLKFSPSVSISDPLSPQIHVRGSDPGENLVQMDGMTIYNPQHFLSSQAIFNPYSIKDIEMLVGGFDAEYGGRNSSILNITTREGHQSEVHGEFWPSISGMSGAVEFPVRGNATAMLSGRIISDLTLRVLMGTPNVMGDFNGSYLRKIGRTQLRLTAFYARDYMDYSLDNLIMYFPQSFYENFAEGFIADTDNRAFGIQTHTLLSTNVLFEAQVYHSGSRAANDSYVDFVFTDTVNNLDRVIKYQTKIRNSVSDYTAKANLSLFTFWHQTLKVGLEQNRLIFFNKIGSQADTTARRITAGQQAVFVQDKIEIGGLSLKFGLRNSRLTTSDRWQVEPRAALALKLGITTLKAAWGRYYQYLTTLDSRNREFIQFLDYYYTLENQKPVASTHYILGIEGFLTDKLEYSVTGYYKDLSRLYRLEYDAAKQSLELADILEAGHGKAYGIEWLLRGQVERLSGWISYTYSRGTRSYPSLQNGRSYFYEGDQPHNLKLILMYKLTTAITASTTFQFSSGYPRTWETGRYNQYFYDPLENTVGGFPRDITPVKNNVRFPPRLLWDIGWKKRLREGFGYRLAEYLGLKEAYLTMTIRNLLFLRRNPYYYFYLPEYGYYGFGMEYFPSVNFGYTLRF